MRFSTTNNPVSLIHSPNNINNNLSNSINIKKVLSSLVSKLPHQQQKVTINHATVSIKNDTADLTSSVLTPFRKENDIYRDLRNYYTKQQKASASIRKPETRHQLTVKQPQQSTAEHHNNTSFYHPPSVAPPQQQRKSKTNHYVREARLNSNHLRIKAVLNNSNSVYIKQKQSIPKRNDQFLPGRPSPLRSVLII